MSTPRPEMPWEILSSEEVFAAPPWIRVIAEAVRLPGGKVISPFYRLKAPDFAMVLPRLADGRLLMLRQYRHGLLRVNLGFPAGMVDPGEPPRATAERELFEETGYRSRDLRHLASLPVDTNRGYCTGHYFLAEGAQQLSPPSPDETEEATLHLLREEEVVAAIADGSVLSFASVTLFLLATHPVLGRGGTR